VQAVKDASERFLHISSDYWHEGQVRLGEVIRDGARIARSGRANEFLPRQ